MDKVPTLALALALVSGLGCKSTPAPPPPPTEKALVVSVDVAPVLPEAEDDEPAAAILHRGDVVLAQRRLPRLAWHGLVEGDKATRDAEIIEQKRSPRGGLVYGFASDTTEAAVPTTSYYCGAAPKEASFRGQSCADVLQRILLPGGVSIAYVDCITGKCPVARAEAGEVVWTTFAGLADLQLRKLGGRDVLLVTQRWVKNAAQTGGALLVLGVERGLPQLGEIKLDEIDSSAPRVINRLGALVIDASTITFRGARREIDAQTGKELATAPIEERWGLDGQKLVRR